MTAIENIEGLKTLHADCLKQTKRIWDLKENQVDTSMINSRVKVFRDYMKRMEDAAGDVLDFCKELIENNPQISYEHYVNEDDGVLESINRGFGIFKLWHKCFDLLIRNARELKGYEREEREGRCEYTLRGKNTEVWRFFEKTNTMQYVCSYASINNTPYKYCTHKNYFEYKLLSRLYDYLNDKLGNLFTVRKERLILFARVLCLYIAMHNEKRQLIKDGTYLGMEFEELQTTTPPPQAKETKAKKTKQPGEVFTERATKYFEEAEKAGYLKKVGDKYEWLYRGGIVALVYFFIRIYEPKSPPFKQLQLLFGVKGLSSSRRNLEKTDWYKDEMKREAMTAEELACERRERKLKKPKEWFPELRHFFRD